MSEDIKIETMKYLAKLSRMGLDDEELATIQKDVVNIIAYIEKLKTIDVEGVEPMIHPPGVEGKLRVDRAEPGLDIEKSLQNAPETLDRYFTVPKIID